MVRVGFRLLLAPRDQIQLTRQTPFSSRPAQQSFSAVAYQGGGGEQRLPNAARSLPPATGCQYFLNVPSVPRDTSRLALRWGQRESAATQFLCLSGCAKPVRRPGGDLLFGVPIVVPTNKQRRGSEQRQPSGCFSIWYLFPGLNDVPANPIPLDPVLHSAVGICFWCSTTPSVALGCTCKALIRILCP